MTICVWLRKKKKKNSSPQWSIEPLLVHSSFSHWDFHFFTIVFFLREKQHQRTKLVSVSSAEKWKLIKNSLQSKSSNNRVLQSKSLLNISTCMVWICFIISKLVSLLSADWWNQNQRWFFFIQYRTSKSCRSNEECPSIKKESNK